MVTNKPPRKPPKQQYNFRLSEDTGSFIDSKCVEWGVCRTDAVERILKEYREGKQDENFIDAIAERVVQNIEENDAIAERVVRKIEEKYKNMFTRMRLSTDFADRNVQTILELMNSVLWSFKIDKYINSAGAKHPILQQSENEIKRRIALYKEKYDNAKNKK